MTTLAELQSLVAQGESETLAVFDDRIDARWLVIGGPACSLWLAARAHRPRRRSR